MTNPRSSLFSIISWQLTCFAGLLSLTLLLFSPHFVVAQSQSLTRKLTIEGVEFVGNKKTGPEVILRDLNIRPGARVTPEEFAELLLRNRQILEQTNFFKSVEVFSRPGSERGKVVAIIEVQERAGPFFQFEGGYNDLSGWFFIPASLRFDNIFGGGNRFGARFLIGDRLTKLSFWYRNKILHDKLILDAELFAAGKMFIHYFGPQKAHQDVGFGGLRVKLTGTGRVGQHFFLGLRAENYDPRDTIDFDSGGMLAQGDVPPDILDDLQEAELQAVSFGLLHDSRDNPVYPLNGFWGALTGEVARKEIRETNRTSRFGKLTFDARLYRRLFGRQVFAVHVKAGYGTSDSPFYERFYLGGANSLRGYADRRLTPQGWGTKLFLTNTEWRFPLSDKGFPNHKASGVIFFDSGGIWAPGETPRFKDLYGALGLGVRYKMPILGTMRFDFAFPLNDIDDETVRFHISLGQTF